MYIHQSFAAYLGFRLSAQQPEQVSRSRSPQPLLPALPSWRHPNSMPEPSHLTPLGAEEQRLYSELCQDGRVILYSLTELIPCPGFCLSDCHSCTPLALSVPGCCLKNPTGQKGSIGHLLQPDSIPHCQFPLAGAVLPPWHHRSAASTIEARNMAHLISMSPASPGTWLKLSQRWELKIRLTGDSARYSQQTLTIRLGLPGLTSILPHPTGQLTIR